MKASWKERFRNSGSKYLILFLGIGTFCVLIPIFVIVFSIGKILDTSHVKRFLSGQILIYTDLEIDYREVDSTVFPLPGFRITDLSVRNNGEEIAYLENLELIWNFYALLYGEFELQRVSGRNGRIFLKRNQNGKLEFLERIDSRKIARDTEEFRNKQKEKPSPPGEILELLPVFGKLENVQIRYVDDALKREDQLLIETLSYRIHPSDRSLDLDWELWLNTARWVFQGKVALENDDWNPDTIRYKMSTEITGLRLEPYEDFLTMFPNGKFRDTTLNLRLRSEKNEPHTYLLRLEDSSIQGLADRYGRIYPPLALHCALSWDKQSSKIQLQESYISLQGLTDLYLRGEYDSARILADLEGERFHLQSALGIAKIFERKQDSKSSLKSPKEASSPNLSIQSQIRLKNLQLKDLFVHSVQGKVDTRDGIVLWDHLEVHLYGGKLILIGSIAPKGTGNHFQTSVKIQEIRSENLIEAFTKEKLISGKMHGDVYLASRLGKGSDFQKHLFLKSQISIQKGELLGYANFIKPIAEMGKWINFQNSTGKSTEFHEIQAKVRIQNQTLYLDELFMKGVGIDAKGYGKYFFQDNKMDMRFQASLSGMAGRAMKIPIIYKGILGKNVAYLDPIWVGSVYAGTLFLAGPAGAVVGGLTGSLASETVEKTAETVQEGLEAARDFIWGGKKGSAKGK